MGYYVQNTFTIRGGGVFSGKLNMEKVKELIETAAKATEAPVDRNSPSISPELDANKGSVVVIAGVFNYYTYDKSSLFAQKLSELFGEEVLHHCWDMERSTFQFQVWLAGRPFLEVMENPLGKVLRHVT